MCPDVDIIGHAPSVIGGAKLLRQLSPDLLFLDIELEDGTSFDLLEIHPQLSAKIIFTTALDHFAVKAFRLAAVDYLLKPIDPDDMRDFITSSKSILDPEMVWYAYDNDKPIAVFVMIPDINQILRKLNGKLNLWGILKFLYYKNTKTMTRTRIILMGVDPKYQRSGIESGIFWHQDQLMKNKPQYTEVELSWAGDFNPKIIAIYEATGAKKAKTHYTMRYMFDRTKKVTKAPLIGMD